MGAAEERNQTRPAVSLTDTKTAAQTSLWNRLEEFWNRIQVGRQGSYSVERLELLDHYCKTTSRTRVFIVCVLTPLPALTAAVLLECLPLRPPSEGWAANWMFWIRLGLMVFTLSLAGFSQINAFIPGFNLTVTKMVIASLGVCIAQTGTYFLEGVVFGFPVPFMWQLGAITMAVYAPTVTRSVVGPDLFEKGVYPLYKVLYDLIPQTYRGVVVVVLPIWKFAAKRFVVQATRELEDFVPELAAFSVDFFSTLFLSVCMATSGSINLSALFIAADVCQSLLAFREVRDNARTLLHLVDDRRATVERLQVKTGQSSETLETAELLTMILGVARNPSVHQVTSLDGTRLWASPPNLLPQKLEERMQTLGASGMYGWRGHPSNRTASISSNRKPRYRRLPLGYQRVSVAPAATGLEQSTHVTMKKTVSVIPLKTQRQSTRSLQQTEQSKELVLQGLQLLFHCEYLALVEYVECIVPLIFVSYKSILEQLPNVVYYPGGGGSWSTAAVANLLVFAVLEVASLVFLHLFLQRKFGFSPLYQLAFVLETQVYHVQANLFLETIFLLQYQLEHLGADFTFRFAWLRREG
ncbi:hypothetical protein PHYPSEUDO_008593 [Phytophthora pseudosyringae]|uniref:Transmembrane protein n=1 Tax=Phytophthora pseudosyringae TaxID=221518 RepID=A0A8T1WEX6_9STRA|nr:hypothetical protein PHYPSEUDO_008593 [Phytophthora pseudosyringae]